MAMASKLNDRLKGMLLETTDVSNDAPSASRPLIEVVRNEADKKCRGSREKEQEQATPWLDSKSKRKEQDDDDEDIPPPISFHGVVPSKPESSKTSSDTPSSEVHHDPAANGMPSLAEQMLADATEARQKQQRQKTQNERRRAKTSTFGMKKGFLNSSSSQKKAGKKSKGNRAGNSKLESEKKEGDDAGQKGENLIFELDSDGNMIPSSSNSTQPSSSSTTKDNPLHFPEVQSAMLSHLQSNSSRWATPDLLDSIPKNHPKLAQGMNNPRYMKALQDMQKNPKETLERLKKRDPQIVEWLMEFCGVMGEHFCKLGEGQLKGEAKNERGRVAATAAAEEKKVREMGPLEKKALKRHEQMQKSKKDAASTRGNKSSQSDSSTFANQPNKQMQEGLDNQVAAILANDELRSILLDPKMQQIMEECTGIKTDKFQCYMSHKEYGPKLRLMMEAGLLRLA